MLVLESYATCESDVFIQLLVLVMPQLHGDLFVSN